MTTLPASIAAARTRADSRATGLAGSLAASLAGSLTTVRALSLSLALGCTAATAIAQDAAPTPWQVAGRQGLMLLVIVPADQARNAAAYQTQLKQFCPGERTCFVNFYTNSSGAEVSVPLPDAIDREATATFRRSVKQGAESFRWACRLQQAVPVCF